MQDNKLIPVRTNEEENRSHELSQIIDQNVNHTNNSDESIDFNEKQLENDDEQEEQDDQQVIDNIKKKKTLKDIDLE
jgi:hypothetical protein